MKKVLTIFASILFFSQINLYTQTFMDIALQAGIDYSNGGVFGGGVSFIDFNQDGFDDITIASTSTNFMGIYKNNGNSTFTAASLPGIYNVPNSFCILWADYDNDGDKDLFISCWGTSCKLFRNNGADFTDVTQTAGIITGNNHHSAAAWCDYDNDGWLDLYVTVYRGYGGTLFTVPNYLYRNNGNGTFTMKSTEAGVSDFVTQATAISFLDYNADGWQDIYITSDKRRGNILYKNNGNGTFSNFSAQSGLGFEGDAMGLAIGDYDNDGDLDMYVSNGEEGNPLFKNNGNGTFTDISTALGVAVYKVCWGNNFYDYDNDGDLDLFVVTSSGAPNARDHLFKNNGNSTFTPVLNVGMNGSYVGYGHAVGDVDNDGYQDMFVVNTYDPCNLYKNSGGTNKWIKIKLVGTFSNRDGIGSKIELYNGGNRIIRVVNGGISYLSQNSLIETIGLGAASTVDSVIVKWPRGGVSKVSSLTSNQTVTITETPIGIHNNNNGVPTAFELFQNYPNPFNPVTKIEYSVLNPGNVTISVYDVTGRLVKNLVNQHKNTGFYEVEFNASDIPSGVYFYKMQAEGFTKTNKMVLIK